MTLQDIGIIAAIVVSLGGFILTLTSFLRTRKKENAVEDVAEYKAPAEREGIILNNAAVAHSLLEKTLQSAYADNERLRDRLAEFELQSQLKDAKIRDMDAKIIEKDKQIRDLTSRISEIERKLQVYLGETSDA